MNPDTDFRAVLAAYPTEYQPTRVEFLGAAGGGFSGAQLWRLESPTGLLCLRRWPTEHPPVSQLEFIQAVLWHITQEGFSLAPLPLENRDHGGYVRHAGQLWQLEPWMPGRADFHASPSVAKLQAAMTTLAQFHRAAASFPLPHEGKLRSEGIARRRERLEQLVESGARRIAAQVRASEWPELETRARQLLSLFDRCASAVLAELADATGLRVAIQPAIRDVWHDHVLFVGERVSGLIDFGAMRPESVAGDVARLLGSLAADQPASWSQGLAAYQEICPLDANELCLVSAFDHSNILMSGLQWLEWIYVEGRKFENRAGVLARIDENLTRLAAMAWSK